MDVCDKSKLILLIPKKNFKLIIFFFFNIYEMKIGLINNKNNYLSNSLTVKLKQI